MLAPPDKSVLMQWVDPFDPNTLPTPEDYEYRIYGNDMATMWAVVDEEDYHFLVRWKWCPTKPGTKHRRKLYMRRATSVWEQGVRVGVDTTYLHVVIMERTGIRPPTRYHTLVDHRNGNGLDCRRRNLRWATQSMNSKNVFGAYSNSMEGVA